MVCKILLNSTNIFEKRNHLHFISSFKLFNVLVTKKVD